MFEMAMVIQMHVFKTRKPPSSVFQQNC